MGHDGRKELQEFITNSKQTTLGKALNFPVYASRQDINQFLALQELFKLQLPIKGSIVECGVYMGSSLFSFAHFSGIYEPSNYHREIIGFDTFEGFPDWSEFDMFDPSREKFKPGFDTFTELTNAANAFQANHYLEDRKKVRLVKGNATQTIPRFLKENKHFVCSMLFIDIDLYEPTKTALNHFLPRMPKGAILAFDEIHNPDWPGETQALDEILGIKNIPIRSFEFNPKVSYVVL